MGPINNKSGNYTIDGVPVTDPQLPYKVQINPTGVFHRNMNATRNGYLVANLKKIYWHWNRLTTSEIEEILSIIYNKLKNKDDTFTVTTYIVGVGPITDLYYIGPLEFENIADNIYTMEIHFIQVNGKADIS